MLEQWEADRLLHMPKVYVSSTVIDLAAGADADHPVESADGVEHFLLDIWRSKRNPAKARFQLRYRRSIVLARMCTATAHTNPDGERMSGAHIHTYREDYADRWAEQAGPYVNPAAALDDFCGRMTMYRPDIEGGV
jgi:uncharacterized protein DUF6978